MTTLISSSSFSIRGIPFPRNQNAQNNGTGRQEVINWIGQVHYDENRTPCQNFVRFVINGGELPSAEMTIRAWEISLEGENSQELHFPQHVRLAGCRLVSAGIIKFYQGVLCADGDGAVAQALTSEAHVEARNGGRVIEFVPDFFDTLASDFFDPLAYHIRDTVTRVGLFFGIQPDSEGGSQTTIGGAIGYINQMAVDQLVQLFGQEAQVDNEPALPTTQLTSTGLEHLARSPNLTTLDFGGMARDSTNLSGLDLSGTNLSGANLSGAVAFANSSPAIAQGIVNLPSPSESNIHNYWYQKAGIPTEDLAQNWENLKSEDDFAHFATLLTRLSEDQLRDHISASDVVEVIQAAIESPSIRQTIFEASREAAADCHERPLSLFNTVQGFARYAKLEAAQATPQELLGLAKGIARQTVLDEATVKVMQNQWEEGRLLGNGPLGNIRGSGPNTAEALEYQMALRLALGTELNLPFPVKSVYAQRYISNAVRLTAADKKLAKDYVDEVMNDNDRLIATLMSQPIWKQYVERSCNEEKSIIDHNFNEQLDRFEEDHEKHPKTDGDYYSGLENLGRAREQEINRLLQDRTRALCGSVNDKRF